VSIIQKFKIYTAGLYFEPITPDFPAAVPTQLPDKITTFAIIFRQAYKPLIIQRKKH